MALIDDLLGLGFDVSQFKNLSDELKAFGTEAQTGMEAIGDTAASEMAFKPFTVTSGTGTATTTADGSTGLTLSPEQQALQDTLFSGAGGLAGQATAAYDPIYEQLANQAYGGVSGLMTQAQQAALDAGAMDRGAREEQVYGQLRALQTPEEERQRLALENRLAAQGRLGTRTEQFGGTPEQLAMAKAQSEAQNQASLMAMQQSGAEQQQALQRAAGLQGLTSGMFGMGTQARMTPRQIQGMDLQNLAGMMQSGYAPESQMLNQLQVGTNIASLADTARRQGAMEKAESYASGLGSNLEAQRLRSDLLREVIGSAGGVIGGGVSGGGLFSGLLGAVNDATGDKIPPFIKKLLGL
jgi:hypothetical protein